MFSLYMQLLKPTKDYRIQIIYYIYSILFLQSIGTEWYSEIDSYIWSSMWVSSIYTAQM